MRNALLRGMKLLSAPCSRTLARLLLRKPASHLTQISGTPLSATWLDDLVSAAVPTAKASLDASEPSIRGHEVEALREHAFEGVAHARCDADGLVGSDEA